MSSKQGQDQSAELTTCWLEEEIPRAFACLAAAFYRLTGDCWREWLPFLTRTSAHVAVLIVVLVAIGLSNFEWPAQAASTLSSSVALPAAAGSDGEKGEKAAQSTFTPRNSPNSRSTSVGNQPQTSTGDAIVRRAQPQTIIPERPRLEIITYTVQAGDTVQSIAEQFGLDPTTIMWANSDVEDAPDLLRVGQDVIILPIDGVYHTVAEGDTLASIAEEYKVEPREITACQYNNLGRSGDDLAEGEKLIVPGGEKAYEAKAVTAYSGSVPEGVRGSGRFQWPVMGMITQGYWYGHRAIDVGAPTGSAVVAADGGFISFAGWTDVGYGYLIVIDHANGFSTYYAHLSNIYVFEGQAVDRGQVVGAVGNTGWSTGPHLHLEVRYNDTQQNPMAYLP